MRFEMVDEYSDLLGFCGIAEDRVWVSEKGFTLNSVFARF